MSFRTKTIIGIASIEVIFLLVLVFNSLRILEENHTEKLQTLSSTTASLLSEALWSPFKAGDFERIDEILNRSMAENRISAVRILDQADNVVYSKGEVLDQVAGSFAKADFQDTMTLEINLAREIVKNLQHKARQQLFFIAGLEVVLVGFFSFMLGTYLNRQLKRMQVATKKIAEGELGIQVAVLSKDEIGETARQFNAMSLRLKAQYDDLKFKEDRHKTVLNTIQEGLIIIDERGKIESVNPMVVTMFGYEKQDLVGQNVKILMTSSDRDNHDTYLHQYNKTGLGAIIGNRRHVQGRHKSGKIFPLELSVNPIVVDNQKYFVGTLRDLSELELEKDKTRASDTLLTEALESINDGFVIYDNEDRLMMCNERYRNIYDASRDLLVPGITFEEIIRTGVARGQYRDAIGHEEEWIAERLDNHLNPSGPLEQKLEDGSWVRVWEKRTKSNGIVGLRVDITELKQREEALQESREQLRSTIDSALDGIVCFDDEGRIFEFNPAAEHIFGYDKKEVMGREFDQVIYSDAAEASQGLNVQWANLGKRIETEGLRKSGERFALELAINVTQIDQKQIFVAFLRDITQRKVYQDSLKEAKQRAEVANEAKAGFLAMMSHEIRTPLNGVLGVLGLMSETRLDQEQINYVQTAKESGEALLTIINDVLDFSKMEAGKLSLEEMTVNLHDLLLSVMDVLRPLAQAKGVKFDYEISPDMPPAVICDGSRVRQVLLNLAGNALKFTSEGEVRIAIESQPMGLQKHHIKVSVHDNGIGIAKHLQESVFGEFNTLDVSYARKFGGTGLGLAISKRLITLMGGHIDFKSEEGRGSTFWFDLTLKETTPKQLDTSQLQGTPTERRSLRVLIAEDQPTNMMIIRKILEKAGHRVMTAANGIEAVQAVTEFPVDLILMDGSMPEMDGLEATRVIRAKGDNFTNIVIIALTAHAMKGDREKFLEAGMNDYLQKPIQKDILLATLDKWSTQPGERGGVPLGENISLSAQDDVLCVIDPSYLDVLAEDTSADMVPELIDLFFSDLSERLARLSQAMKDENREGLQLETHTIGSSAITYGLMELHAIARASEAAVIGGNWEEAVAQASNLCEKSKEAIEALKKAQSDFVSRYS